MDQCCCAADEASPAVDVDSIDFDDDLDTQAFLENYRSKRLAELQQTSSQATKRNLEEGDHGEYAEVDEKEFLRLTTSEKRVVCHFYHSAFARCKIVDGHLQKLASKHYRVKFIRINAENAPFLIEKMKIRVLPCIVLFMDAIAVDRIVGFEELGNTDNFRTEVLEHRLSRAGVLVVPKKSQSNVVGQQSHSTAGDYDSDDD